MKTITKILAVVLAFAPCNLFAAPLTGTAGSNLTAFNGASGSLNNNQWNEYTNVRTSPTADFGNCNSLILRCAQPKCANGGCTTMEIAYPIVYGCVMANDSCKSHGEALIQTLAAQLVANSNAKANQQAASAQAAATSQAAQQSEQQLMQMQQQLQQMQQQMETQNAQALAAQQAAIEQQTRLVQEQAAEAARQAEAARIAEAVAAPAQQIANAASMGVSADILAREQASGRILTQIENAEVALKTLKSTMQNVFDYAGCDSSGNNCTGPKRVKAFKEKAKDFFDPYETVLDEVYDALIMAQSLGVDITDIYMMLNGTCNVWGKYLCTGAQKMHYDATTCNKDTGRSTNTGVKCTIGQVIPMNDGGCQLIQMLNNNEEVQQNWLYPDSNDTRDGTVEVRVGCASEALDNSVLFRGRKKQATIDIETLRRIIEQDAPSTFSGSRTANPYATKFCSVNDETKYELEKAVNLRQLTSSVCVPETKLQHTDLASADVADTTPQTSNAPTSNSTTNNTGGLLDCSNALTKNMPECLCRNSNGNWNIMTSTCNCLYGYRLNGNVCVLNTTGVATDPLYDRISSQMTADFTNKMDASNNEFKRTTCNSAGGIWMGSYCDCTKAKDFISCHNLTRTTF